MGSNEINGDDRLPVVGAPAIALDAMSIYQVSISIAICLFFMMYPIMVKIDFTQIDRAFRAPKPVALTLVVNWLIKPFTMLRMNSLSITRCTLY
jgi:ACR3 family arsenite efflux pump ArsB